MIPYFLTQAQSNECIHFP